MDNFRRNQTKKSRPSVDGIVSPNTTRLGGGMKRRDPIGPSSQLMGGNTLGNFRSSDGFRANQQPQIKTQLSDRPRQPLRMPDGAIDLTLPHGATKPKLRGKRVSRRRKALRGFVSVLITGLLIVGFLSGKGYLKLHQIFKGGTQGAAALQDNVDPSKLRGEGDGRVNILMLGRGGDGHDGPDLTDTILIASLDPLNKKASLLSIPRDLYYPKTGNYRINSIFAEAKYAALARKASKVDAENAGFTAIEKVVQEDMGIPIHYHVMVDFAGFEEAINTVGGVDINVTSSETVYEYLYDESTGKHYTLDVKQGQQHFDGQRALFFARSRHTSPRGDFDRAERQRKLLIALKDKILTAGTLANPAKLSGLISAFGDHVQTNMTSSEVLRLYDIGKNISSSDIATIGLVDPPNNFLTSVNIAGQSIQQPRAGLTDFSEIQNFVRNTLKDGFIANENATIAVYNGTAIPGLATKKAAELKSYGYNVTIIADAPTKTYTQTVLVDLRNGQKKYTKHYLEQRLGVTTVSSLPDKSMTPGTADFVIILGQ